jgi:hypothetical protein
MNERTRVFLRELPELCGGDSSGKIKEWKESNLGGDL